MARSRSIPRALCRPTLAWLLLGAVGLGVDADERKPASAGDALTLQEPIAPPSPSDDERGVGLRSLDANGPTVVALRSDGRILVVTDGRERIVEAPEHGEAFRSPIAAADGVPVVVTTHGRVAWLEPAGVRYLVRPVQRSAKPAAIPGSADVVLGSENGSIRRLDRSGAEPRLTMLLEPGGEPIGTLAASRSRIVYFRCDGVLLSIAIGGGEPVEWSHPRRTVRAIRLLGERAFGVIGGDFVPLDPPACGGPTPDPTPRSDEAPDVDAMALTADGSLVALLADGVIEVRAMADGTRVRSRALRARHPTALAWSADGRTLLVATVSDARPFAIPVLAMASRERAAPTPR